MNQVWSFFSRDKKKSIDKIYNSENKKLINTRIRQDRRQKKKKKRRNAWDLAPNWISNSIVWKLRPVPNSVGGKFNSFGNVWHPISELEASFIFIFISCFYFYFYFFSFFSLLSHFFFSFFKNFIWKCCNEKKWDELKSDSFEERR